jgi:hypothetical protein
MWPQGSLPMGLQGPKSCSRSQERDPRMGPHFVFRVSWRYNRMGPFTPTSVTADGFARAERWRRNRRTTSSHGPTFRAHTRDYMAAWAHVAPLESLPMKLQGPKSCSRSQERDPHMGPLCVFRVSWRYNRMGPCTPPELPPMGLQGPKGGGATAERHPHMGPR